MLTVFADKLTVRDYVEDRIGISILNDLLLTTENPDTIDFSLLPQSFVIKANHGCGWLQIITNKNNVNRDAVINQCKTWMGRNYYDFKGEWAYKNINPCLMIEKFLKSRNQETPDDYKFFCFDGVVELIMVDVDRFGLHRKNFYYKDWTFIDGLQFGYSNTLHPLPEPKNLERMIEIAEALSAGVDMLRVDLYNIDGQIIFGELTNYPLAAARPFRPVSFDRTLGSFWHLPTK